MKETVRIIQNFFLLCFLLFIYSVIVINMEHSESAMSGKAEAAFLLIFTYPLYHFKNVLDRIIPITIWTLGFLIVFCGKPETVVGGALMLLGVLAFETFVQFQNSKNR